MAVDDHVDLVILDNIMPKLSGWEVTRIVKNDEEFENHRDVPIIMFSAMDDVKDKVEGFELGVEDYITKPFSPREVVARVKAVLRRADGHAAPSSAIRVGQLKIDLTNRSGKTENQSVSLTPTEVDRLAVMARNPGRPYSREQLMDLVYDVAYGGYDRAIDSHIKNLRRKIEPEPRQPRYVLTVYGVGYKVGVGDE